jgi:predicted nucleic acid-binding protein
MEHHILDSSAWLECLDDGPNVKHFGPILRKLPNLIIPAVVLTEVRKVALKQRTVAEAEAVTDSMRSGIIVPADEQISILAADLYIKHKLPLADSLIYATALIHKATLWTQDADFDSLPHVKYFPKTKKS